MSRGYELPAIDFLLPGEARGQRFDERFTRVLRVAAEVIAEDGYEKATIRRIASRAQVSIAGLYYYVKSKEEALYLIQLCTFEALLKSLKSRLEKGRDLSPEQQLRLVIENHLQYFLKHLPELKVCARELDSLGGERYQKVLERRREYYHVTREVVDAIAGGAPGVDSDVAALSLFGMLNWVYMWFNPRRHSDLEKLEEQLGTIFINGIKPRGGFGDGSGAASAGGGR